MGFYVFLEGVGVSVVFVVVLEFVEVWFVVGVDMVVFFVVGIVGELLVIIGKFIGEGFFFWNIKLKIINFIDKNNVMKYLVFNIYYVFLFLNVIYYLFFNNILKKW